jgi:hypothetical protein
MLSHNLESVERNGVFNPHSLLVYYQSISEIPFSTTDFLRKLEDHMFIVKIVPILRKAKIDLYAITT